jgi:hypothetical protein
MLKVKYFLEWQGGGGPVPWSEIASSIDSGSYEWIEEARLPRGAPFKDPGDMNIEQVYAWISHLEAWQEKTSTNDEIFQFRKVYTANQDPLPHSCEAVERVPTHRGRSEVWLLTFDTYIDRPQCLQPIRYPQPSWDYLFFLENGKPPSDPGYGPDHWKHLPARTPASVPVYLIGANEKATVLGWLKDADEDIKALVESLIDATNDMENKLLVWVS